MFVGTIVVTAYVLRLFEIPYYRAANDVTMDSYFNAVYMTIITITTIGYGDICPMTKPGIIIILCLAMWGSLLMSIFVVTISSMWILSEDHQMAQRHIDHTKDAAQTIFQSLKYYMAKKKLYKLKCHYKPKGGKSAIG